MGRKTDQKNMFDQIDFTSIDEYEEFLYDIFIEILEDAGYSCERDYSSFHSLVLGRELIIDNNLSCKIRIVPNIGPWTEIPETYCIFLYPPDTLPFFFKWIVDKDINEGCKTLSLELMKYFLENIIP